MNNTFENVTLVALWLVGIVLTALISLGPVMIVVYGLWRIAKLFA